MGADRTDRLTAASIRLSFALIVQAVVSAVCATLPAFAQTPDELRSALAATRWSSETAAFYEVRAHRSAWFDDGRPSTSYFVLAQIVDSLAEQGLDPLAYGLPGGERGDAPADIRTTETALRLARHLLRGRIDPRTVYFGWSLPHRDRRLPALLSSAVDRASVRSLYRSLEPSHGGYVALKNALAAYRQLLLRGGWPSVDTRVVLHPGDTSATVEALRRRLQATDDLAHVSALRSDVFDDQLLRGVLAFQERHGLEKDGIVGRRTFEALNAPVERRMHEIELNMERWRWMPERMEGRRVEINIPAFEMHVVDDGRDAMRMKAIVGTPVTRTPVFSTRIEEVVLAPYWVVPRSIEVHEIIPKLGRDPGYLERNHIHRTAGGMLRQNPGPSNPLGRVKFTIPNPFGVGLHDTPERYLFDRAVCAFSHGCIRLERPEDLAVYLLEGTEWSRNRIRETVDEWREVRISLERPMPLDVLYWTAWVDGEGRLQFRHDVYGYDDRLYRALNAK